MTIEEERKAFEAHNHFQFLMPFIEWNGEAYIFKESNSLLDTQRYYNDYLHFIDFWSYWLASANRQGYKFVPVNDLKDILKISDKIDDVYCEINNEDNIQELLIEIDVKIETMIGGCDE